MQQGDWAKFGTAMDRLRSNFVAARLNEAENHAQQLGNPGNVGLHRALSLHQLSAARRDLENRVSLFVRERCA